MQKSAPSLATPARQVDVRIIAATNQDLKEMIAGNQFRSDLYFRLHVVPVTIPPLRERTACLVVMARNRQIEFDDLPGSIREATLSSDTGDAAWHPGVTLSQMVADLEKKVLARALEKGKTQVNAARMLGLNQSTIARKIRKYGLDKSLQPDRTP